MEPARTNRIRSIDILRGAIMIIMALDHTRDYFHQPALIADPLNPATTTIFIYFTRWITHFCAPTFVLLSGISAYLSSLKKTKKEASLFLIKRGFWLILMELTVVNFGINANPFFSIILLQVIWAIGWCMIILGLLIRTSPAVILITGLIIFFGHNIVDSLSLSRQGLPGAIISVLFGPINFIPLSSNHAVAALYPIIPWTGIFLIGYSIGKWFTKDFPPINRKKLLVRTGLGLILLFIVLRATNLYGNPRPFQKGDGFLYNLFAFLNTNKYPPSLLFSCMTLGPACLALALLDNVKNKWSDVVSVYGRVPFFYFICHFYLLHLALIIVFYISGHTNGEIFTPGSPILFRPNTFGWGLPVVYLIWLSIVIALYLPCRWFSKYKQTHNQWWLSYV
ncbi:MAG: heparan-alpha-glucosaminide N-acetyltransferase domain-containing protein [Chitinophagaceae bacterium]